MFIVVIFHLFYVLVKICVVFVEEINMKVIPVKYKLESNISTKQKHAVPLQI